MCQKAGADPRELTNKKLDAALKLIVAASTMDMQASFVLNEVVSWLNVIQSGFQEASYNAIQTLAFVSPETVLPRINDQLCSDLDPALVKDLTETDIGIWRTPEGIAYVDGIRCSCFFALSLANFDFSVLSNKGEARPSKGKDADIAKWEEDLRKSLANKKAPGTVTLTKQQRALVQAQLEKEAKIRQRVAAIKGNLERGLNFIRSLVSAGIDEFRPYIASLASLLLAGALGYGSTLVGESAFDTYLVSGHTQTVVGPG